jgi:hypothetical protein
MRSSFKVIDAGISKVVVSKQGAHDLPFAIVNLCLEILDIIMKVVFKL